MLAGGVLVGFHVKSTCTGTFMSLNNLMVLEAREVPSGSDKCGSESRVCHFPVHLDRGTWQAIVHGVPKELDKTERLKILLVSG